MCRVVKPARHPEPGGQSEPVTVQQPEVIDPCEPPLFCGPWPWIAYVVIWAIFFAVVLSKL
jgi:hypothetical protein